QVDAYTINLRRNFGYGGGVNIRGTFTIHLVGDETKVQKVTFLIDDKEMASVDVEPFTYRFNTDDYGFGTHRLSAEVHLLDGSTQRTPESQYNFVSSEEVRRQVGTLVGGLVGVIVFIVVIIAAVQFLFHKKKRNQVRQPGETPNYGMLGGTICPKCGQPFPRHLWGVNLLVGRLDRCDHCGKWVMTVRATPAALKLAEEAEQEDKTKVFNAGQSNKELKDQLEDTKYIDQL
ncbi:MAG: Ig-like domain-containing protein, partial [Anaerolineales bacterium]